MSVKLPLQSIFSHLYPSPEPEEPAAPEPAAEPAEGAEPADVAPEETGAEAGGEPAEEAPAAPPAPPDKYEQQISTIEGGLNQALARSEEAANHLMTSRSLALADEIKHAQRLDLEHGLEQRKTGLPIGPSHLELEHNVLETHGLLHAKDLLVSVQNAQRARQSDTGTGKDILAEEAASRPPPHYMVFTQGFESNIASKGALIASVKSLRALSLENRKKELLELEKQGKAPDPRKEEARRQARAKADAAMPMEQQVRPPQPGESPPCASSRVPSPPSSPRIFSSPRHSPRHPHHSRDAPYPTVAVSPPLIPLPPFSSSALPARPPCPPPPGSARTGARAQGDEAAAGAPRLSAQPALRLASAQAGRAGGAGAACRAAA